MKHLDNHSHNKENSEQKGYVLAKAVIKAQENLGLSQKDLSEIIHISESTIHRLKKGSPINPESSEGIFAIHFLRIYRSLDTILGGDDQQSKEWLYSYNDFFANKPINLLKSKSFQELNEILTYLDFMRGNM